MCNKFYFTQGKTATETKRTLKLAFRDEAIIHKLINEVGISSESCRGILMQDLNML
jgi:hypothetical protein